MSPRKSALGNTVLNMPTRTHEGAVTLSAKCMHLPKPRNHSKTNDASRRQRKLRPLSAKGAQQRLRAKRLHEGRPSGCTHPTFRHPTHTK